MSDTRDDSTSRLVKEAEVLRRQVQGDGTGVDAGSKRAPSTRQLVRSAERMLKRSPGLPPGTIALLKMALVISAFALAIALLFFLWG